MYPEGWLMDPHGRWLLLFQKDPISSERFPTIYIDKWSVSDTGTPKFFKNRRKVELEPALETWSELRQNGWALVNELSTRAA